MFSSLKAYLTLLAGKWGALLEMQQHCVNGRALLAAFYGRAPLLPDPHVKAWREGATGHVMLDRPERRNALNRDMLHAVSPAFAKEMLFTACRVTAEEAEAGHRLPCGPAGRR
jgi:hypothetical protein